MSFSVIIDSRAVLDVQENDLAFKRLCKFHTSVYNS